MLRRHFPEAVIYGDIRELTRDKLIADTDRRRHVHSEPEKHTAEADEQAQREPVASDKQSCILTDTESTGFLREKQLENDCSCQRRQSTDDFIKENQRMPRIDLLTGGFPCQPFSQAGKRKGTSDNRYLWPEMLRVIQDFKPTWIIAENVRGLLTMQQGMVFENICLDLEKSGYEVQAFIIPACAVNAPHRRDRVWIVAHSNSRRGRRKERIGECYLRRVKTKRKNNNLDKTDSRCRSDSDDSNATSKRCDNRSDNRQERHVQTDIRLAEENKPDRDGRQCGIGQINPDNAWSENWLEAATRLCVVDDGLSRGLVRLPDGTTISRSKWRQEALKAAGNAIVPQVAMEIMKAIKETEQPPQEEKQ